MRPMAALLLLAVLAGCGGQTTVKGPPPAAPERIRLTSPAFADGGRIPRRFTCDGAGVSPPLRWSGVPAGTRSLALLVEDPDAPGGTFVHWTAYAIPPDTTRLAQGDAGGAEQGANSFGKAGYGGPCPPHGQTHRYVFTLYALRSTPSLPVAAKPDEVRSAIAGAALARGALTGRYER